MCNKWGALHQSMEIVLLIKQFAFRCSPMLDNTVEDCRDYSCQTLVLYC